MKYINHNYLTDRLNKMCPFWDTLDEIFTQKVNLTPVALYETAAHDFKKDVTDSNDGEFIIDDNVVIDFSIDENETSFTSVASANESQSGVEVLNHCGPSENYGDETDSQFALTKRLQKKPKGNQNNSTTLLYEISKMRNETTQKKLELETARLQLEEKKIAQDYEIRKMEVEARKLEAENLRLLLTQRLTTNDKC